MNNIDPLVVLYTHVEEVLAIRNNTLHSRIDRGHSRNIYPAPRAGSGVPRLEYEDVGSSADASDGGCDVEGSSADLEIFGG